MQLKCISHSDSLSGSVYRGRGITLVRIRVRTLRLELELRHCLFSAYMLLCCLISNAINCFLDTKNTQQNS